MGVAKGCYRRGEEGLSRENVWEKIQRTNTITKGFLGSQAGA